MFFRTLCAAGLFFAVSAGVSQAEMRPSGQPCFDNAVTEAANGGNLQQIMQRHISVVNIAAAAAWHKWQIRWKVLDDERRAAAVAGVQAALAEVSDNFFEDIDLDTLVARSKPIRYGHLIWGSYNSHADNSSNEPTLAQSSDSFELGITPECKVVRVIYNNIRLSSYVANRL